MKKIKDLPPGWVRVGLCNDATHTISPNGDIQPFNINDCLRRAREMYGSRANMPCKSELIVVAEALSLVGDTTIKRDPNYDPTPYCTGCRAMTASQCDCGPIAENE